MDSSSNVDLDNLKARLAKLGVHIEDPPSSSSSHQQQDHTAQHWEPLVETNPDRHNKTLAQLLGRCARVHHVINGSDDDNGDDFSDTEPQQTRAQFELEAAAAVKHNRQQRGPATSFSSSRAAAGRLKPPDSRTGAASSKANGSGGVSAPLTDADSKLLVRAAQRLLEDAQDDAHQGSRTLKEAAAGSAGAGAGAGRRAAGRASAGAGASSSNTGRRPAAAVAAVASVDDLRNSPLGSVLAQYKEAQAAWAQERAKLRREAVTARKEASQARLELAKASRSSEHRAQETSSLKAALKGRDVLLEELQGRIRQLEDELARCQEVAAERLVSVSRERDDLQALLLATLERLEGVEAVVAAADATSAAMEDKVRVLESERLAALQTAATARQEVCQLQEARRRLEWQSQLLEKMSKVQLQQNKRKTEALKDLLATTTEAGGGGEGGDGGGCEERSANSRAREDCGKASAALQQLLDQLLDSNIAASADAS